MTKWRTVRACPYVDCVVPPNEVGEEVPWDELRQDEAEGFSRYERRARAADPHVRLVGVRFYGRVRWMQIGADVVQDGGPGAPILPSGARVARRR